MWVPRNCTRDVLACGLATEAGCAYVGDVCEASVGDDLVLRLTEKIAVLGEREELYVIKQPLMQTTPWETSCGGDC